MLPPFSAVIFDMDGLCLDTESSYSHAWTCAAADFGVRIDEGYCQSLFGRHADDVMQALRAKIGDGFDRRLFHERAARYWLAHVESNGVKKMPGLDELLEVLERRRIPYALATNSEGIYARQCLRLAGAEAQFPLMVSRDQVAKGKPEPDLFLAAARLLGAAPASCLVLEDSETGLLAARKAQALPILVQSRPSPQSLQSLALAIFASLRDIARAIEKNRGAEAKERTVQC